MLVHYGRLSEKARRQYACLEVVKLGYGSKGYIQKLLGIGQKTIERGLVELNNEARYAEIPSGKQRRAGGGRKKILPTL